MADYSYYGRTPRRRHLTKKEAEGMFRNYSMPEIRRDEHERGRIDWGLRQQEWAFFVDGLARDGSISQSQADRWQNPRFVVAPWRRR